MLDDFVARVFHGSARPLVLALLKDRRISKRDLEEISKVAELDE
jgi:predicted transcriptional regulator